MLRSAPSLSVVLTFVRTTVGVFADILTFLLLCFRSPSALAAENLFLRKQLRLYVNERSSLGALLTPSVLLSLLSPDSSTGGTPSRSSTRHIDSLASQRVPIVLEVEIATPRTATRACRRTEVDR